MAFAGAGGSDATSLALSRAALRLRSWSLNLSGGIEVRRLRDPMTTSPEFATGPAQPPNGLYLFSAEGSDSARTFGLFPTLFNRFFPTCLVVLSGETLWGYCE